MKKLRWNFVRERAVFQTYKNIFNIGYIEYWRKRENICSFLIICIILHKLWQNSYDTIVRPVQQSKATEIYRGQNEMMPHHSYTPLPLFPYVSLASHNCALSNFGFLAHV